MIYSKGFVTISVALLLALASTQLLTFALPRLLGHNPPPVQSQQLVCPADTPLIPQGRPLRIMDWNVQFMAGAYYPFWTSNFDQPALTKQQLDDNLERIVAVIREQDPDILNLQEIYIRHPVTHDKNQMEALYKKLADRLPCYGFASFWKARMIPRKHMVGSIETGMVTLSRYRLDGALLRLLPSTRRQRGLASFYPHHSLLETQLPLTDGGTLTVLNTHLDAPTLGRGEMSGQIHAVLHRLTQLTDDKQLWVMSGDFNMLPPGFHQDLPENQKSQYPAYSPLTPFYNWFTFTPSLQNIQSDRSSWLTAYDLNREELDLTLDYIFHPKWITSDKSSVLHLPLDISDHMPVLTTIHLPNDQPGVQVSQPDTQHSPEQTK